MWRRARAGGLLLAVLTGLLVLFVTPAGAAGQTRGGGIDGGLPDTTNGADPVAPPVDTVPATVPATTATTAATATTATTAPVATTAPAAPATTVPAASAGAAPQTAASDTTVPITTDVTAGTLPPRAEEVAVAAGEEGPGAVGPASASASGGVRSPSLLLAGVAIALAGAVVLAVRSRRAAGEQYS